MIHTIFNFLLVYFLNCFGHKLFKVNLLFSDHGSESVPFDSCFELREVELYGVKLWRIYWSPYIAQPQLIHKVTRLLAGVHLQVIQVKNPAPSSHLLLKLLQVLPELLLVDALVVELVVDHALLCADSSNESFVGYCHGELVQLEVGPAGTPLLVLVLWTGEHGFVQPDYLLALI